MKLCKYLLTFYLLVYYLATRVGWGGGGGTEFSVFRINKIVLYRMCLKIQIDDVTHRPARSRQWLPALSRRRWSVERWRPPAVDESGDILLVTGDTQAHSRQVAETAAEIARCC